MENTKASGGPAPTSDQIRDAIDSGRTGDKVAFPDPAAAPLGTDEEAGGAPASPVERRMAAGAELRDVGPAPNREKNPRGGPSQLWLGLLLGVAAAAIVGVALYAAVT